MFKTLFESPSALFFAVLVHAALISVLVFSFDWSDDENDQPKINVVQAVVVDESKIKKQIESLKRAEQKKIRKEKAHQDKLKREAKAAKKARVKEEKRLAALQKKGKLEQKRNKEQEKIRKKEEKRLVDIKKKQKLENRKHQLAEKKRKIEESRLAKARADRKRLAEQAVKEKREKAERKRRQSEKEMMLKQLAAEEAARQKEFLKEQDSLAAEKNKVIMSKVTEISALIIQRVESKWTRPPNAKVGLKCTVLVRLIPGGDVSHVEVIKSSGDEVFDKSVVNAVYKSVPFPVPSDLDVFDKVRNLEFVFDPKGKA